MPRLSKGEAKERIQKLIDQIRVLVAIKRGSPEFTKWRRDTRVALENIFSDIPERVEEFTAISYSLGMSSNRTPESSFQNAYVRGLRRAEAILQSMVGEIEEYWPDDQAVVPQQTLPSELVPVTNEVFVIHGHDHGTKETVARFLLGLDLKPIILHEQPNQGRTIIEKFEDYAQVSYAVVLLTPDDVGGPNADELSSRARQNVILELGFFLGQLGRGMVAAMVKGDVDIPTDYSGVLYIPIDDNYGWKLGLAMELRSAGFAVDLNNLA